MIDDRTRLEEARKQIQIVAERLEDQDLSERLHKADSIIEPVEEELPEEGKEP